MENIDSVIKGTAAHIVTGVLEAYNKWEDDQLNTGEMYPDFVNRQIEATEHTIIHQAKLISPLIYDGILKENQELSGALHNAIEICSLGCDTKDDFNTFVNKLGISDDVYNRLNLSELAIDCTCESLDPSHDFSSLKEVIANYINKK